MKSARWYYKTTNMKTTLSIILFCVVVAMPMYAQDADLSEIYAQMEAIKLHQDSIDSSTLMAVYDYRCMTQDAEGETVVDAMRLCLQVGTHCTRSFPYRKFERDIASENRSYMDGYELMDDEEENTLATESYCFMPEVWRNYPEGKMTVRDAIPPFIYEAQETLEPIKWKLSEDTLTVCGYLCKKATCELHGRKWTVSYSEEIPTSAGPWKLCGLPGLIVDAKCDGGIHSFTLTDIQRTATTIYMERNAITTKISEKKLITNRNKTFGYHQYIKDPLYYAHESIKTADKVFGKNGMIVNGTYVNDKPHKYQPLELK